MNWRDYALCAQTGGDQFFPAKGEAWRKQKELCFSCPVREQCLKFALDNEITSGIWGGTSGVQRRHMLEAKNARPEATQTQ
jgi:WhiB family redox-sensing transcriptional regulator